MIGLDARALLRYLVRHPAQAPALVRAGWRLRARGWWRRRPYLPLPDRAYWRFRVMTATGSVTGPLDVRDVLQAAQWSNRVESER